VLIVGGNQSAAGYDIDNSLRFDQGSNDYLNRTPSAGNKKTWTWSGWVKRGKLASSDGIFGARTGGGLPEVYQFISSDVLQFYNYTGSFQFNFSTNRLFRDTSAWYHIVFAYDSTQATSSNRFKLYVNGVQETSFSTATYPPLNYDSFMNSAVAHYIGAGSPADGNYFNGYLSEINFIDGQQLDPTSFGEFDSDSGVWKPIPYTGSYGTNGFFLEFQNSAALGTDSSGNGNTFTVNNLTSIDQTTDTPTNNFATTNPLDQNGGMTFSDGNLSNASTSASWRSTRGTFGVTQGKWFYEVKVVNTGGPLLDMMVGWADFTIKIPSEFSSSNPALTYTAGSGNKQLNGVNTAYGATYNVGDIIGVAFDADALTVTFYKNGTSQGSISTGWSSGIFWSPAISLYGRYGNTKASFNFGSPPFTISSGNSDANGYGNFEYAVPSGYYSLNTKNLAEYG
jgi:hypothetical protein